jgi:hypothetical protein
MGSKYNQYHCLTRTWHTHIPKLPLPKTQCILWSEYSVERQLICAASDYKMSHCKFSV